MSRPRQSRPRRSLLTAVERSKAPFSKEAWASIEHSVDRYVGDWVEASTEAGEDWARTTIICGLRPGQKLRIVKFLAYGWSSLRSLSLRCAGG